MVSCVWSQMFRMDSRERFVNGHYIFIPWKFHSVIACVWSIIVTKRASAGDGHAGRRDGGGGRGVARRSRVRVCEDDLVSFAVGHEVRTAEETVFEAGAGPTLVYIIFNKNECMPTDCGCFVHGEPPRRQCRQRQRTCVFASHSCRSPSPSATALPLALPCCPSLRGTELLWSACAVAQWCQQCSFCAMVVLILRLSLPRSTCAACLAALTH